MSMLQRAGGEVPKLKLMKWAFILSQEMPSQGGDNFYQFVPYRYGPYSFSLQQEMESLIRDGLVEGSGDSAWQLTIAGQKESLVMPPEVRRDVVSVLDTYGQLPTDDLIDTVYTHYPWFTVNAVQVWKRRQEKPKADLSVYTMGYERLLVDGFLNWLMVHGLCAIVDVRNNPISRRYGFHKNTLARLCQFVGLGYHHFPELGIPTESRQELHSQAHYSTLFTSYERDILPREQESVYAVGLLLKTEPTALICMEANPDACHRSRLANALMPLTQLPVTHLGWPR